MSGKGILVALAGNPNSGKTSIFNTLTGTRQRVGNYAGVTVESKEGRCEHGGSGLRIVDLPGTYSLSGYSAEELVARHFLVEEKPDVVVDVIDSSNLERNLYLAVQLIELGVPLVLAFNMSDEAKAMGLVFDLPKLASFFGAPIVETVGHRGQGMKELLDAAVKVADGACEFRGAAIHYGKELELEIAKTAELVAVKYPDEAERYGCRWLAVKLLEDDREFRGKFVDSELVAALAKSAAHIEGVTGDTPEIAIASDRYGFISGACQEAVRSTIEHRHSVSDRIDNVLTNRVLGLPIFMILMYLVFFLTFTIGEPPMGWIESGFEWLGGVVEGWWPKSSDSALKSLLVDGLIGGVGGVVVFLPNILLLFLAIAFLEDTGYMARAAFIMDRLMHKIGLHGKSFIPMLIGFGCTVPAIMATRMLENRRDRLTTMLVAPLMSCGARLPIYMLIIPAFFPAGWRAPMLWFIYVIGIVLAVLCAKLLRISLFRGESVPFVMELPPYRLPTIKSVCIHMWERSWLYLKKAGTIILGVSIILWALTSYPQKTEYEMDYSALLSEAESIYLGRIQGLNESIGLPVESDALAAAFAARLRMDAAAERFHESEDGFAAAIAEFDKQLEDIKSGERGGGVAAFLDVGERMLAIGERFEREIEHHGLEEFSPGYLALAKIRDEELAALELGNSAVFNAVKEYLEGIQAEYLDAAAELRYHQRREDLSYTFAGRIGHTFEPLLKPMGFDWRIGTALVGAFAAKEVFVAQMGIVFSVGEAEEDSDSLRQQLRSRYTPLVAFCIMLFCLISTPCVATVAVVRRESGSWGWALFQVAALTLLAYMVTVLTYQVGNLLGIGVNLLTG